MPVGTKKISGKICALSDDLLGLILNSITNKDDRKSFSEVCKQWLRVEGLSRSSLSFDKQEIPLASLTRFPNLVHFETWKFTTDTDLEFIAQTCPKIEMIKVTSNVLHSLGRKGLWALAIGCPRLSKVSLSGKGIDNRAVFALVNSAQRLTSLEFHYNHISDPVLRAVASQCYLTTLKFTRCCNITDLGLGFLANGCISKTLKSLVLQIIDGVTDTGIEYLRKMRSLEQLHVSCYFSNYWREPKITHIGAVAIFEIQTLKVLRLSLEGISDATIVALAENRSNLEVLHIIGCHEVTGDGIRAFSNHQCLKHLVLFDLKGFNLSDVESVALGCPSLESVVVDLSLRLHPAWSSELMHHHTRKVLGFYEFSLPFGFYEFSLDR